MEINEFKTLLFERAKQAGFTDCEIYCQKGCSFHADIFEGAVKEYKNARFVGLSFRGNIENKTGYAYTEKLSEDIIDFLIERAKQNAAVTDEEPEQIFDGSCDYIEITDIPVIEISANKKIDLAKQAEKAALKADTRVEQVIHSCTANSTGEIFISNAKGLDLYRKADIAFAYVYVKARESDSVKVGMEVYISHDFTGFKPAGVAREAVNKAVLMLGARDVKTGKYPVIFNNKCAGELLSCFAGVFSAENVQKGFSLLSGKLNTKIASDHLTLNDYATHPQSVVQIPFDDEGVKAYNKSVIENGVLKTFLHNQKTAAKEACTSTGNGFKSSFKSAVSVSCVNLFIEPSDISESDLIKQMGNGILITAVSGLHAGANAVSGDFSLKADGFLINEGKKAYPIEQFTVGGNFYTLLSMTEGVAGDLYFGIPSHSGAIGAPAVWVRELMVSGGE